MRRLVRLSTFATLAACAPGLDGAMDGADGPSPMDAELAIYGGTLAASPRHDAVVAIHARFPGGGADPLPFCTGTLVAPHTVLTAAHCLDTAPDLAPAPQPLRPDQVAVYFGGDPSQDFSANAYGVVEVVLHPDWASDLFDFPDDLALIRLDPSLTLPASPLPILPRARRLRARDVGTLGEVVGFGWDGPPPQGERGVKQWARVPLLGAKPGSAGTQFGYAQLEGGPCGGDSGGPMLTWRSGTWYVSGVTSYGDLDCTEYGVSAHVAMYEAWLLANL